MCNPRSTRLPDQEERWTLKSQFNSAPSAAAWKALWAHSTLGPLRTIQGLLPQPCGHRIGDTAWGRDEYSHNTWVNPPTSTKLVLMLLTDSGDGGGGIFVAHTLTIRATANRFLPSPFRTLYTGPFFFHPRDILANQTELCAMGKVQRNRGDEVTWLQVTQHVP